MCFLGTSATRGGRSKRRRGDLQPQPLIAEEAQASRRKKEQAGRRRQLHDLHHPRPTDKHGGRGRGRGRGRKMEERRAVVGWWASGQWQRGTRAAAGAARKVWREARVERQARKEEAGRAQLDSGSPRKKMEVFPVSKVSLSSIFFISLSFLSSLYLSSNSAPSPTIYDLLIYDLHLISLSLCVSSR